MPPQVGQRSSKTLIRIDQIARYRVTGRIPDYRIAAMFGMTMPAFKQLIALPDYKAVEEELLEGRITDIDRKLAEDDDLLYEEMKTAVPAALRALVEGVTQRKDLRVMLGAAKEILDRDPDGKFGSKKPAPSGEGGAGAAPQLPENVITYLMVQSNQVASEITAKISSSGQGSKLVVEESLSDVPPVPPEGEA